MHLPHHLVAPLLALGFFLAHAAPAQTPSPKAPPLKALALRDLGLAELENERPEKAEAVYRELVSLLPRDPLGHGNLAIALLRQQKFPPALDAVARGLALAAGSADLLLIKAEIQQWSGDNDTALLTYEAAAAANPNDPELLYTAYQLAAILGNDRSEAFAGRLLSRLTELRPENLVLQLQLLQRAIKAGDRAKASGALLRVGELMWQASEQAQTPFAAAKTALEKNDLAGARVPAIRLENVLKITPMFRECLRELKTGIQGIPVRRLQGEIPATSFGEARAVTFTGQTLDTTPVDGRALAFADFDGDEKSDLAWIRAGQLELRLAATSFKAGAKQPAAGFTELRALDLDNDGHNDLVALGPTFAAFWRGAGNGSLTKAELLPAGAAGIALTALDFDIEGDLDLAVVGARGPEIWRNNLAGKLENVGAKVFPKNSLNGAALAASDLDRDGDLDLAVGHSGGVAVFDNLRQGRFQDQTAALGLKGRTAQALVAADFDNDGLPDLIAAGPGGLQAWRRRGGRFEAWPAASLATTTAIDGLIAFDADNDGRLDLAAMGKGVISIWGQQNDGSFRPLSLQKTPVGASKVVAEDFDSDGDLDLALAGPQGLALLNNQGGNAQRFLRVRLRGLDKGNSKNNLQGWGSVVEARTGAAYQFREAESEVVHLGLGSSPKAEILRVVWTNGVPQNRLAVEGNQRLVEEQLLKGSCPFLYAWDGKGFRFVTDLLWGAPIGLPAAPDVWVSSDPSELVKVEGLVADAGSYKIRVTEELWEAAFFDHVALWVVDHPSDLTVASNLRIVPGQTSGEQVLGLRDLRPLAAAWDGAGREVTTAVARRDEIYADGYSPSPYQGVATPWTFTIDLGTAPAAPLRLLFEGWIFPADASLNLAVAQRADYPWLPPRLEVETNAGWQTLMPSMGFPAGKTKTMFVDTPPLPAGARRLRLVSSFWLHWDRIAWSTAPDDDAAHVVAKLAPRSADLRFRGFSTLLRHAPNGPHAFDYQRTRFESPWLPFPGRYTRYGAVDELLALPDDFSVILAPGDEIALEFDATALPAPAPGFERTLFLESHGWDKDADRNTGEGQRLEPLPFRAMTQYPYAAGEAFPETPAHRNYVEKWLNRVVEDPLVGLEVADQ